MRNSQETVIERISDSEKQLIDEIVQKIVSEEKWIPFRYPVDFSEYPEYYAAVPYPMYMELICKRLKNNFYRNNSVSFELLISLIL